MPFIGGDNFIFFSPIFNFADAAISCGVIILLLFYKKYSSDSIHMIKNDLKSKLASCKLPILGYPLLDGRQSAPV